MHEHISLLGYFKNIFGRPDTEAEVMIRSAIAAFLSTDIEESDISLLYLLTVIMRAGSIGTLWGRKGGAQERKLFGSFQALIEKMEQSLLPKSLALNSPAQSIESALNGTTGAVEVSTRGGNVYVSRSCILAIQPTLYPTIRFIGFEQKAVEAKLELAKKNKWIVLESK